MFSQRGEHLPPGLHGIGWQLVDVELDEAQRHRLFDAGRGKHFECPYLVSASKLGKNSWQTTI